MAHLLSRLWVTVISLHLLALHQQPAHPWLPLPWLMETVQGGEGHRGRDAHGWRCNLVLWVRQQGGPWGDHGPGYTNRDFGAQIHQQGSRCSCDWKPGGGKASCEGTGAAPPSSEERSPALAENCPQSGPGRHRAAGTGVSGSWSDFFPTRQHWRRKWEAASFVAEIHSGGLLLACRSYVATQEICFC